MQGQACRVVVRDARRVRWVSPPLAAALAASFIAGFMAAEALRPRGLVAVGTRRAPKRLANKRRAARGLGKSA